MKNIDFYNKWTEFLQEFKEYFNVWIFKLIELKEFINVNKKLPNKRSTNLKEKKLGEWIQTNTRDYKNKLNGMKKQDRYNEWTQFLQEYSKYFNNDNMSVTSNSSTNSLLEEEEEIIPVIKKTNKSKIELIEEDEIEEEEIIPVKKEKKSIKLQITNKSNNTNVEIFNKKEKAKTEISQLHKRYKTMNSQNLFKEFNEKPELWHNYHQISESNEESFPEEEIPRNRIIKALSQIKTRRTMNVVDMGCGKAQIAKYYINNSKFNFVNYDHISSNELVIECDISNTLLEEHTVDICILCLAMWGSNCKDYIKEANRILESGGKLYIIEPTKRWSNKDENDNIIQGEEGYKLKQLLEENGFKIIESNIEKFCFYICVKI